MNPKPLLAAVVCVWFFVSPGFAQVLGVEIPLGPEMAKVSTKVSNRAAWNGSMVFLIGMAINPEIREGWNISDEQYQQLMAARSDLGYRMIPEYLEIEEERDERMRDPLLRNTDERTRMDIFLEFEERLSVIRADFRAKALDDLLTTEQKKKIWEYELVNMENWQLLSLHMFEAFDLTDAQKQELEIIKKEFEPEFERQLDDYVNRQDLENQLYRQIVAEHEKQGGNSGDLTGPKTEAIRSKLLKEDPEFKKKYDEMKEQRKLYSTRLKIKMFDVLTDEQWDRLQELLDNPPDYIKAFRKKIQEAAEKAGTWQPGPDSWKPGDGIPEEYRQQRQERRFPRKTN